MKPFAAGTSPVVIAALIWTCGVLAAPSKDTAEQPVALRVESLTVTPASQPLIWVDVQNLQDIAYRGTLTLKVPDGWRISPAEQRLTLGPGQFRRVSFDVLRGVNLPTNRYAVEVAATGAGIAVVHRQQIVAATAPYFKPTIDGDPAEWKDAVPVTFTVRGKKTVINTYWNKRRLSLLVAVEEDRLVAYRNDPGPGNADALQVAVAPQGSRTGTSPEQAAERFEFLFAWTGRGTQGKCFQLARPGMKLAEAARARRLEGLELETADVAVSRHGHTTYYECSLPMRPMREKIPPAEGREFCMSVLVHDPDGTGIREWGQAAGLWPWQRNRLAWSRWPKAKWGEKPPFDNKTRWGLCSSKY